MSTDTLKSQLAALIGPEEEWPDEVRQVVLCYGVEPGESCPDSCSHRPVENCACDVLPSDNVIPALLAVARMVKRGTCGECRFWSSSQRNMRNAPIHHYCFKNIRTAPMLNRDVDFGCTLFSPAEEPQP